MLKNHPRKSLASISLITCTIFFILLSCAPHIKNFSPEKGPVGTTVTINGKRFAGTTAGNTVEFQGVQATDVTVNSTEQLVVKVPAGARTGLISVTTDDGTGRSEKNFDVTTDPAWTFMVYLDADNNLEPFGITDFMEMASVGSSANLNIVVQMDRIPGESSLYGNWTDTRRFHIQKGDTPSVTPVQNMGELNMGDPNVLRDFVEWGVTNYPAQNYALVIWNHGDGWRLQMDDIVKRINERVQRNEASASYSKTIASDNTDHDELYMREVQDALEAAKTGLEAKLNTDVKLDLVGFDACLMGMLEVAFAIRNSANFMVGSEDSEPGNGWPYDTILAELSATPTFTPRDLAGIIVNKYIDSYPSSYSVCQSALDLSKLDDICEKLDDFTKQSTTEWDKIKAARLNSLHYYYENPGIPWYTWGTDLKDFIDNVHGEVSSSDIKAAATALKNSIDAFVVNERHTTSLDGTNGLAIYFPPLESNFNADPYHTAYNASNTDMPVDFVIYHNWDNWLVQYYANIP